MTLLEEIQAAETFLGELRRAVDAGQAPDLGDAALLERTAEAIRELVWHANIDAIKTATPEQDNQAQRDMTERANEHADRLEANSVLDDIETILDDTEPQLSGLRDNREAV